MHMLNPILSGYRWLPLLAVLLLGGCAQASLLEGLDERQANEVVSVLLEHNIGADKRSLGKAGFQVEVAPTELREAIAIVRHNDLPSPARAQVAAAFPADAMVSTPLGERARLFSAIEQRLEESLGVIAGVRSARVHVSYDTRGTTQKAPQPTHLAAVLLHEPGVDEEVLLQSVKRFLRNSFTDVDYDNVSVVLSAAPVQRVMASTEAAGNAGAGGVWLALAAAAVLLLAIVLGSVLGIGRLRGMLQKLRRLRQRPLKARHG